jgi:HEPN domain-containing protein
MNGIEEARSLLRMAHKDFLALQGMMDGSVFADEIFGFHAQQAMEKSLKAWLACAGRQFPLTHELTRLLS